MKSITRRNRFTAAGIMLLLGSASLLQASTIGFVVSDGKIGNALDPFDEGWTNHLVSVLGHDVVRMYQNDGSLQFSVDMLIISSDVGSGTAAANYDLTTSQPIITTEYGLFDDMNLTSDGDEYVSTNTVTLSILSGAHPLAAGLSGNVVVYSGTGNISISVADDPTLASGLTQIAGSDRVGGGLAIGVLDKGALDLNGVPSPGLRIMSHGYDINDWAELTGDGLALLDAQVAYAVAAIPEPGTALLVLLGAPVLAWFRRRR